LGSGGDSAVFGFFIELVKDEYFVLEDDCVDVFETRDDRLAAHEDVGAFQFVCRPNKFQVAWPNIRYIAQIGLSYLFSAERDYKSRYFSQQITIKIKIIIIIIIRMKKV